MSRRYSYIVFDLDGTLMDTYPGVVYGVTQMAQQLGLRSLSEDELRSVIGPATEDSLYRLFGLEGEDNAHAMDVFAAHYATMEGAGNSPFYSGVLETLKKLREHGCKISIATMKPWIFTKICLSSKNITDLFDSVVCYEDNSGATKAELILRSLKEMGGTPEEALMIGDTVNDSRGAAAAGLDFAAVTGGFGFKSEADLEGVAHVACAHLLPDLWPFLESHIAD